MQDSILNAATAKTSFIESFAVYANVETVDILTCLVKVFCGTLTLV